MFNAIKAKSRTSMARLWAAQKKEEAKGLFNYYGRTIRPMGAKVDRGFQVMSAARNGGAK
jgi:hypothetical protein